MGFPGAANCTTHWFKQHTDHFSFGMPSGAKTVDEAFYQQRYLTYDAYYQAGGPIFFYAGNEGPITIFADIAGLMWQNAEKFGAAIVFAEHRFFGKSQPCGGEKRCFPHLSTMQAMADYAVLLTNLTGANSGATAASPQPKYPGSAGKVISFGGSYGGMLSAYMRMKYPNIIAGSVASSGPVTMVSAAYQRSSWWVPPTRDATGAGGSSPNCARNVYDGLRIAMDMAASGPDGLAAISAAWQTCKPLEAGTAQYLLGMWVQNAFGSMAMGNYPVPLNFIFGTYDRPAPAWPVRVACEHLSNSTWPSNSSLIAALNAAMAVVNNVTKDVPCNMLDQDYTDSGNWDYMVCSEEVPDSQPYFESRGWPHDMFYAQPKYTREMMDAHCMKKYGITTRWGYLNTTYGAGNVAGHSNIVFANGLYDPWHTGGILHNVSDSVRSYIIPDGAHHLDLLFETDADPAMAKWVRRKEMEHVAEWLGMSTRK